MQDAMVDCHFMIGFARVALAADPDLLGMQVRFLVGMGAEIVSAVSPHKHESLTRLQIAKVIIGDLEDMEKEARANEAQFIMANTPSPPCPNRSTRRYNYARFRQNPLPH